MDHVGPIARCAADAAAIMRVIAGADPADPTSLPGPAPDVGQAVADWAPLCYTAPFDLTGSPTITVPGGFRRHPSM
jgi:Asp-tRNA(Asn)/Glu-tRNA(Gln) amidotransferase A subunit family amidase